MMKTRLLKQEKIVPDLILKPDTYGIYTWLKILKIDFRGVMAFIM